MWELEVLGEGRGRYDYLVVGCYKEQTAIIVGRSVAW